MTEIFFFLSWARLQIKQFEEGEEVVTLKAFANISILRQVN